MAGRRLRDARREALADRAGDAHARNPRQARTAAYRGRVPTEPPPTPWAFPDPRSVHDDLVASGADLEPGTLLGGYRAGYFPMPFDDRPGGEIGWWSPVRRGVLPLDGLRVSRSLRRSVPPVRDPGRHRLRGGGRRLRRPGRRARLDQRRHPGGVPPAARARAGCTPSRPGATAGWPAGCTASRRAGCSPGSRCSTARPTRRRSHWSDWSTCSATSTPPRRLVDVQWSTPHLASLGVVEIDRADYLAPGVPLPAAFG